MGNLYASWFWHIQGRVDCNFSFQFLEQSWVSQNWNGAKGMIANFSFEIQQMFLDNFEIVMSPVLTLFVRNRVHPNLMETPL